MERILNELLKCKECLKVLHQILKKPKGISPYEIQKTGRIPYATIDRCVKKLKKLELVTCELQLSSKGGEKFIYKPAENARSAYDTARNLLLLNGEEKLEIEIRRMEKLPGVYAEDILRKMLNKRRHN